VRGGGKGDGHGKHEQRERHRRGYEDPMEFTGDGCAPHHFLSDGSAPPASSTERGDERHGNTLLARSGARMSTKDEVRWKAYRDPSDKGRSNAAHVHGARTAPLRERHGTVEISGSATGARGCGRTSHQRSHPQRGAESRAGPRSPHAQRPLAAAVAEDVSDESGLRTCDGVEPNSSWVSDA